MVDYYVVNFESFEPVYSAIELPANVVFCRGYSTAYAAISNRPAYFTYDYQVACAYGKDDGCKTGAFVTQKSLKLLDLRYICNVLQHIFENRKSNKAEVLDAIYTLTMSFGLCTLRRQIELVKIRLGDTQQDAVESMSRHLETQSNSFKSNPVEMRGVRVGATKNDAYSVELLRELFTHVDGYIAPALESPFHIEKSTSTLPAEIVIFNPLESQIKLLDDVSVLANNVVSMRIEDVINGMHVLAKLSFKGDWENRGGADGIGPVPRYNPNKFFDRNIKRAAALERKAKRIVSLMRPRMLRGGDPPIADVCFDRPRGAVNPWPTQK
jgi:hypothetical protein